MIIVISYFATLIPLIALDAIWLTLTYRSFYLSNLGSLFSHAPQFTPVLIFYPLYAAAVMLLAVEPALASGSWMEALWRGAVLGLAAYGAYDLTNQATLTGWPTLVTFVDMGWGVVLTALASAIAFAAVNFLR